MGNRIKQAFLIANRQSSNTLNAVSPAPGRKQKAPTGDQRSGRQLLPNSPVFFVPAIANGRPRLVDESSSLEVGEGARSLGVAKSRRVPKVFIEVLKEYPESSSQRKEKSLGENFKTTLSPQTTLNAGETTPTFQASVELTTEGADLDTTLFADRTTA